MGALVHRMGWQERRKGVAARGSPAPLARILPNLAGISPASASNFRGAAIGSAEISMDDLIHKAEILHEALPYIRRFQNRTFVIKYGGHAMIDATLRESFAPVGS